MNLNVIVIKFALSDGIKVTPRKVANVWVKTGLTYAIIRKSKETEIFIRVVTRRKLKPLKLLDAKGLWTEQPSRKPNTYN